MIYNPATGQPFVCYDVLFDEHFTTLLHPEEIYFHDDKPARRATYLLDGDRTIATTGPPNVPDDYEEDKSAWLHDGPLNFDSDQIIQPQEDIDNAVITEDFPATTDTEWNSWR